MKMLNAMLMLAASVALNLAAPAGRAGKSLNYYDYAQPAEEYADYGGAVDGYDDDDADDADDALDYDQNDLSRALPERKKARRRPHNSPIYYIRLPPQPYMYVPGFGYVSQPPPDAAQQFLNVPVSFVANGKPANIYRWSGLQRPFPTHGARPRPPAPAAAPRPTPDSAMHRLPGQFAFNGKPEDVFVLRDAYNSLYSDALQNFYP